MAMYLEKQEGIYKDKPELVYRVAVDRGVYVKRLRRAMIAVLASGGVFIMLGLPLVANSIAAFDVLPDAVRVWLIFAGRTAATLALIVSAARVIIHTVQVIRRPSEEVRFYDQGFVWRRKGGDPAKYGWNAVKTVRENPRAYYFRGVPVLQWGDITLKMREGAVFRLTPAHGDLRAFLQQVRPHYAAEIGTRMGQRLRLDKTFKVHEQITVTPAGLVVGEKTRLPWKNLHVTADEREFVVSRLDKDGNPRPVIRLPAHEIDNLAGLMELVEATTESFQRPNPYA